MQDNILQQEKLPGDALFTAVFIDACDSGIPVGEIASAYLPVPIPFRGAGELMLTLDELYRYLDPVHVPSRPRFAEPPQHARDRGSVAPTRYHRALPILRQGQKPLLLLIVKTRLLRNGSWQGLLHWPDARKERRFASALECIAMVLEAFLLVVRAKGPSLPAHPMCSPLLAQEREEILSGS